MFRNNIFSLEVMYKIVVCFVCWIEERIIAFHGVYRKRLRFEISKFVYKMAFAYVLSSSDDEGFVDIIHRRPNNVRRRPVHFDEFDDVDFHARFRLSKECITEVMV